MVQKEGITTLQVKVKTRAKLDKLGDIHKETYDDIIQRLIHFYKEHKDRNHKK
ncbi:MAG: hypothetical protein WAM14_22130 [Candidatus Nitrosopolaris sp.]